MLTENDESDLELMFFNLILYSIHEISDYDTTLIKNQLSLIDYILKNESIPLEYRSKSIVENFILEYSKIDKTESNIIDIKTKWATTLRDFFLKVYKSQKTIEVYNTMAYELLEISLNIWINTDDKIELKNLIVKKELEKNIVEANQIIFDSHFFKDVPVFKMLVECISQVNLKLYAQIAKNINDKVLFPYYLKIIKKSDIKKTFKTFKGVFEFRYGYLPTLEGFSRYLLKKSPDYTKLNTKEYLVDYVLDELDKFDSVIKNVENKRKQPLSTDINNMDNDKSKLNLRHQEIALVYYYDELELTDRNAQNIAELYGQKSGVVLMKKYREVRSSVITRRNSKYSKKYLETIIPLLKTKEGIEKAQRDLANVKTFQK